MTLDRFSDRPIAALLQRPEFLAYLLARSANLLATHMLAVALGWQVYNLTNSAVSLGLIGLAQFTPVMLLFPLTGLVADRVDRRSILSAANAAQALAALVFFANALSTSVQVMPIYITLLLHGAARAFLNPATRALLPNLVPYALFPNAVALSSTISKVASLSGPVLGGVIIAVAGDWVFAVIAGLFLLAVIATRVLKPRTRSGGHIRISPEVLFAGVSYIRGKRILLGAITLDLFAVLFGTILGILPVFARDILHVGPEGLGLLRASPAIGAVLVAILLARMKGMRESGRWLFVSLAVYGSAIIVFGMSSSLLVSVVALGIYGAADMVSIFIRQTLMQMATPDEMRGRVGAVDSMFTNGSEELGNARSGVMAAALGPVEAVALGGLATLSIAAAWWWAFPEVRQVDRLDRPL
jgi:MFS family permease